MRSRIRVAFEALRTLAFGSISTSYAAIGTPLTAPCRIVKIFNGTNLMLRISLDGTTDHDAIPPSTGQVYDITGNREDDGGFFIATGTQFYAKTETGTPSSGNVYLTVIGANT